MTRSSSIGFAFRLWAGLTVVAGLAMLAEFSPQAVAAKPAPPPPGVIYFKFFPNSIRSMTGAGGSVAEALPVNAMNALTPGYTQYAIPCNHLSGGSRWFISLAITGYYDEVIGNSGVTTDYPHHDLVAVRKRPGSSTEIDVIQLTDFYGIINFFPQTAFLSNDSNENIDTSFVAATARDIRHTFVENPDGTTSYDSRLTTFETLRLPLTVSEFLAPGFEPFDGTMTDVEIDNLLWPYIPTAVNQQATTSPDGNLSIAFKNNRLLIVDATAPDYDNPIRLLWDGNVAAPSGFGWPQWSPDGTMIAFTASSSDVWTIPAAGGTPKKVLSQNSTTKYIRPIWSTDSQHVVATKNTYSGTTVTATRLVRTPKDGGTITDLGQIGTGSGPALRWVPSN